MKVKDVMHTGAQWASASTPIRQLARQMSDQDIGAIPIGENDRLIGMVTDRDIACRGLCDGRAPEKLTARDIMTEHIIWCHADEALEDAIHTMEAKKVRRLAVMDNNKRLVGILSLGDIAHAGRLRASEGAQSLSGEILQAVAAHH